MNQQNKHSKRECCLLLRELSQNLGKLKNAEAVSEALKTIGQHCVLMRFTGKSKRTIDLTQSECKLSFDPENAQAVLDEIAKTIAVSPELSEYYDLLAQLNGLVANNPKTKQLSERLRVFLAQMREGERRFGRVPDTPLLEEDKPHNLEAGDVLKRHPLLANKTQFDGINPKSTPNPVINSEAEQNAEKLQHQLQHQLQPKFNPRPTTPGKA